MITSFDDFRRVLRLVFVDARPPKPLHLIEAVALVRDGSLTAHKAAGQFGTTAARVHTFASKLDPAADLLGGAILSPLPQQEARIRNSLGQLVVGSLAEKAFEERYRASVGSSELQLLDDRHVRGDTDYLVFNGSGRQVFRMNIKFHGALFRRARELVGLEPTDCFALATYKIYSALQKQEAEHLPYIFVIVGVPGLTGSIVGEGIPENLVHLSAIAHLSPKVSGKRQIEDQIVSRLTAAPVELGFAGNMGRFLTQIREAEWYVLSARRADNLLRKLLFERAYALRVRAFARNYSGAELDMHFSLKGDLKPLAEFFEVLHTHGMTGLASRLERGTL